MSKIKDILEDERTIKSIAFDEDGCWEVGVCAVTEIKAYGEPGLHCNMAFFAVYEGDQIRARVPATMVVVNY